MKREVALGTTTLLAAVLPLWFGVGAMRWFGLSATNDAVLFYLVPGISCAVAGIILFTRIAAKYFAGILAWLLLSAAALYDLDLSWRSYRAGGELPVETFTVEIAYLVIAVPMIIILIKRLRARRRESIAV